MTPPEHGSKRSDNWAGESIRGFEIDSYDEATGRLTFDGRVEKLPLTYHREYLFADDRLEVAVTVTATEDLALRELVETIPIFVGPWKARGAAIAAGETKAGRVEADRFTVTDSAGAGVAFELAGRQPLNLVPKGLRSGGWRKVEFGRVEVSLPATWNAGQTATLRYTIRPL